jgi:hypothetical protein
MDKIEKIISILEKESLTNEEEHYLKDSLESDGDLKRLSEVFMSLKSGLENSVHLDDDLLTSYLLQQKGNEPDDKLVYYLQHKIEDHLNRCSICRDEYKFLDANYSETEEYISSTLNDASGNNNELTKIYPSTFFQNFNTYKYAFASVMAIFILYVGLFSISSIITPDYKKDLFTERNSDFYKTRGRTSLQFQKALDAIQNNNFSEAANYLSKDIKDHANESSIFYSHYILGLSYLKSAESNFLGMFSDFDKEKVKIATENLMISIEKNISGNYDNLKLDAHYYLARSYLLLSDPDQATEHLTIVINQKGKFYIEAKSTLEYINK